MVTFAALSGATGGTKPVLPPETLPPPTDYRP
jgi:hypothetical protein